jgi:2-iminobutanoate/2-iminopropanoate deaminase
MTEAIGQKSSRHYIRRDTAQARAYSQAVVTEGGKTVWLAGQVVAVDASGRSLAGDFDAQVREVFPGWVRPWRRPGAAWPIW